MVINVTVIVVAHDAFLKKDTIRCRTITEPATASPPVAAKKASIGPNKLKTCCDVLGSMYPQMVLPAHI